MNFFSPISEILKFTKPQVAAFKKLGLETCRDLLFNLPYRYLDFSKTAKINELRAGENFSIQVKIKSINSRFSFRSRMSLAEAVVYDETGSLKVVWFNQSYLAQSLKAGDEIFLAGQPDFYKNILQLTNPIYEKVSDFPVHTSRLVPVYHLTKNLYPRTLRNAIKEVLPMANELEDILPADVVNNQHLMKVTEAIKLSHFPTSNDDVIKAQMRFNFEELFISQLLAQKHKLENIKKGAFKIKFDQNLIKTFVESLPFKLTTEQKQAAWDILQDLEKPEPMNRLLEGDVGSGKTLVALIAALQTIADGFQVALLAPTEILARQHYETALKFFKETVFDSPRFGEAGGRKNVFPVLLTNTFAMAEGKESNKKDLQKIISGGKPGLYIGTHALIQKNIKFKKLALVIIDEQHRFGVEQRAHLVNSGKKVPHLLSLSATPIPRTLKLALTGELDISIIKTKPSGRKPIITKLVSAVGRQKAYQFIAQEIKNGRQAFVITPLIEEGESDTKSAKLEAENLTKIFPNLKIGLLHGKMKGTDKEAVMADFLSNKVQILVSTSVVEVGVDVPNASVMVIEGAERFGLSQLHQFRGRVGRSDHQSYCFLFISDNLTHNAALNSPPILGGVSRDLSAEALAKEEAGRGGKSADETLTRLTAFTKTTDGFELAELDLKQRGFGKLFGQEQSGFDYKYFNPDYLALIPKARQEAKKLLADDANLVNYPLLNQKLQNQTVHFE
jgi:ATP-dependent DNA helicase RecG